MGELWNLYTRTGSEGVQGHFTPCLLLLLLTGAYHVISQLPASAATPCHPVFTESSPCVPESTFPQVAFDCRVYPAAEEQRTHPQAGISCVWGGFSSRKSGKAPHEAMRYNSVVSEPEVGESLVHQRAEYWQVIPAVSQPASLPCVPKCEECLRG